MATTPRPPAPQQARADDRTTAGHAGDHTPGRPRTRTRHRAREWRRPTGRALVLAALSVGLVLVVTPFVWMLLSSVKSDAEIRQVPPTWWPAEPTLDNFVELFQRLDMGTYAFNSLFVAVAITLGNAVFCSMVGYALAKIDFPGRKALFVVVLGTLMVPGMVTFVPLFVLVSNMGLVNTYAGMILPFLVTPLGVFLMRQFIAQLPDDLIEAARIDGASELRIFCQVIMPLTGPAVATLSLLTFLGAWNNFLWPLVVAQTEDMYTLPVAIALYSIGQNATQYGLLMAGAVVVVVPILVLFVFLQRYFVQGIATTGIK
ncbi:carbohydrate ABC transporter permease [Nocardiopsis oceani]